MSQNYEKIFDYLPSVQPSSGLLGMIMGNIEREKRSLAVKRKIVFFSSIFMFSLILFFPTTLWMINNLKKSGFLEFSSLIFSDTEIIMSYWKSFAFSLLETLPVTSSIFFLVFLLSTLESLIILAKNLKEFFSLKRLSHV